MSVEAYLEYLEQKTAATPDRADLWSHLGLALGRVGENQRALAAFDRAIELNPGFLEAAVSRCFVLLDMGRIHVALREFRRIATAPDDFATVFPFGVLCMRVGWKDLGLRQLERAEKTRPSAPFVLACVAQAFFEAGREKEARARLAKRRRILRSLRIGAIDELERDGDFDLTSVAQWSDPAQARLDIELAGFLNLRDRTDAAHGELLRANARLPGHSRLMVALGRNLLARDASEDAMDWLSGAILVDPTCHEGFFETAFLHACRGDLNRAEHAMRRAVTLRPLYPDYRFQLGTLLTDLGKTSDALAEFEIALMINPDYAACSLQLANVLLAEGEPRKALAVLNTSVGRDWPEALRLAAECHHAVGDEERAHEMLDELARSDPGCPELEQLREEIGQAT